MGTFVVSAIVGDITPADGVPKEEKSRREREAIDHMCSLLGGGSRGKLMAPMDDCMAAFEEFYLQCFFR